MMGTKARAIQISLHHLDEARIGFHQDILGVRTRELQTKANVGQHAEVTAMRTQVHHEPRRALQPPEDLPIEGMAKHILQTVDLEFAVQKQWVLTQDFYFTCDPTREPAIEERLNPAWNPGPAA
jgi:hypothetical protein